MGTEVDPQLVRDLPLNGRTFQSLISLAPGVVRPGTLNQAGVQAGSFINGQRDNYFTVDGVSANLGGARRYSDFRPPSWAQLTISSRLTTCRNSSCKHRPIRLPMVGQRGGQLEIVTRSGSNQYHGSVFDYFRNEALDANDWFSNFYGFPRPALRHNDFGGNFGGPILKNRTFFFFSYEGLRLLLPQPFEKSVPSVGARQAATGAVQQLLNAFPLPNGPEDPATMLALLRGYISSLTSSDNASLRIDHAVSQKLIVFGRYSEAPSDAE